MSSDSVHILVIEGTVREGRRSAVAAEFVVAIGRRFEGVVVTYIDPRHIPITGDGYNTKDSGFADAVANADGFFIVTPEYNHSFPGSLKRLLDTEYESYHHKPVAFAGVSDGDWGGARAVEGLLPFARAVGLLPIKNTTYFPRVQDVFDDNGNIRPEYEAKYTKNVTGEFKELLWVARALKWGRENL